MDSAYVIMLLDWLQGNVDGIDYIRRAHLKVGEYLSKHG